MTFALVVNFCFAINLVLTRNFPKMWGDDGALSTNELIEVICEALGKKVRIWSSIGV